MTEIPDQKVLWDAYGHALGAAAGLELTMRIALLDAARTKYADSAEERQAALTRIQKKTFGGTVTLFLKVYPGFGADEKFQESIANAKLSRNHLAHHFLEGRLDGLRSEEGVELMAFECMMATEHFRSVEEFIRAFCPADFNGFFQQGEGPAEQWVASHPLRERLAIIKAGGTPEPLP